jgi:HPr kinase/phosphorylase
MPALQVRDFLREKKEDLELSLLAGSSGLSNSLSTSEINRPQLALTGHLDNFAYEKIQILGKTEIPYLRKMDPTIREDMIRKLLKHDIPCIIITTGLECPEILLRLANEYTVPILRSQLPTGELVGRLLNYLDITFAPRITIHGVLVDVFGVGLLILGKSGVGKSECALELIERGHRLVADDMVEIYRAKGGTLYGTGSEVIRHHMEIRGVGVIDISRIFGVGVIRDHKRIELVVHLEDWVEGREYDRLGLDHSTYKILDVKVTELTIPVAPGRNLSIILEVAAMNHRLKELGYHPVERLNKILEQKIAEKTKSRLSRRSFSGRKVSSPADSGKEQA